MEDKPVHECTQEDKKFDAVDHPYHYTQSGYECIDVMEHVFSSDDVESFCLCNAFKYLFRCKHKMNYIQDIKKAVWYLNKVIQLYEKENPVDQQRRPTQTCATE